MNDELLRGLPRDIKPGRDLWPGIEGRLRRRRTGMRAGWIGVAAAAGIILALAVGRRTVAPSPVGSESAELQVTLASTTGPRSATARSLARHLAILDAAIGETETALQETPGDHPLLELLQTLQRRRFALLAQAARFAAES